MDPVKPPIADAANSRPTDSSFDAPHRIADLSRHSARGGVVMLTAQGAKLLLTIVSTVVLARLLTPADFGLVAMVTALTNFLNRFKDLGLAGATVQRASVTHEQVSTLFWINAGFGLLLAVLLAALSPAVAWFYSTPQLTPITLAFGFMFVVTGLSVQQQALLQRRMSFAALAAADVSASVVATIVAIGLALRGWGYWSLVHLQLAQSATLAAGLWLACGWRPGAPARGAGVRSMLAFGGNLAAVNVLDALRIGFQHALIGRFCGAAPLGLYSKANQLLRIPVQQISIPMSQVAVPALSRLQDDPERYRAYYRRGLVLLTTLGGSACVFMAVSAEPLVLTVLGEQWREAVNLFRLLAPAALIVSFGPATSWPYISLGQTGRQLRWIAFGVAVTIVATIIGLRWGAYGVAASYSIAVCALRVPGILYCLKLTPLRPSDVFGVVWRPIMAAVGAGAIVLALHATHVIDARPPVEFALDIAAFTVGLGLCWVILPGGWRVAREMFSTVSLLRRPVV